MTLRVRTSKSLPVHRVHVLEPAVSAASDWTPCRIDENLIIDATSIHSYCIASWDPRVYDAILLAAAIEFSDRTKRRPSQLWGRELHLRVPVHDPELWGSERVSNRLHSALELLTGDRWRISFEGRKNEFDQPPQFSFPVPDSSAIVMPFSDGLDSLAVSKLLEGNDGAPLCRVRLGLKQNAGGSESPFARVPFRVTGIRTVETSNRSRGFKFMMLCGVAARLIGAEKIVVPESGQGALGPVLLSVGQAYEDYRCHPRFTVLMAELVSAVFGHQVQYQFPRLWHTKGQTLAEAADSLCCNGSIADSRSCWQDSRYVSVFQRRRQCGICAACMLRRLSLHTTRFKERAGTYVWDDLTAARFQDGAVREFKHKDPSGALWEHAIAGTLHLDHLANLSTSEIYQPAIDRECFYLSLCLGLPEHEIQTRLEKLLKQHRMEWLSFLKSLGPRSFVANWTNQGWHDVVE